MGTVIGRDLWDQVIVISWLILIRLWNAAHVRGEAAVAFRHFGAVNTTNFLIRERNDVHYTTFRIIFQRNIDRIFLLRVFSEY